MEVIHKVTVEVPLDEYVALMRIDARVDALIREYTNDKFLSRKDVFAILGVDDAPTD